MREQLLAYLLDDLNPAERSNVEAALADSPELQQELEKLRECLGCCEAPTKPEPPQVPPPQLASRTCHFVEHAIQKSKGLCGHSAGVKTLSESHDPLVCPTRWSLADIGVGTCVLLALAALVFPMLKQDRDAARLLACQNNLHSVGAAIMGYSYVQQKGLPSVGENDNAGIYVVTLTNSGAAERKELSKVLAY